MALGDVVYVRYRDHALFRDVDPDTWHPFVRECIGWLAFENDEYIRVVWERFAEPNEPEGAKQRAVGPVILKSAILELRRLNV